MNKAHRITDKILRFILTYLLNPAFFISVLGPTIVGNNYFKMEAVSIIEKNSLLSSSIHNEYTYALISFNIQFFVLVIATVYFTFSVIKLFHHRKNYTSGTSEGLSVMSNESPPILHNHGTWGVLIITVGVILAIVTWLSIFGFTFIKSDTISLYLKSNEKRIFSFWDLAWPPFGSRITWFRFAIAIFALIITAYQDKIKSSDDL